MLSQSHALCVSLPEKQFRRQPPSCPFQSVLSRLDRANLISDITRRWTIRLNTLVQLIRHQNKCVFIEVQYVIRKEQPAAKEDLEWARCRDIKFGIASSVATFSIPSGFDGSI